ncbi:HEPN domain-containing protein [Sphingobium yanoikuyae]|uniref:HEPN domain-containing protein n=1 Tax=Sphingobium TaxID=165695 RepID=UPI0028A7BBE4|nr:HEPN domain-containing protein [Sphingobium yanoikuyae]
MKHTQAYIVWRSHSQKMLDFAVLVTTAAPQLNHALQGHVQNSSTFLATNPAFRPSNEPYATERRALPEHQKVLGATLVLSIFSYFETYFFSVIDEIISFHGGCEEYVPIIASQLRAADAKPAPAGLRFLQKLFKSSRADRYRKYSSAVSKEAFMWPSHRFMLFGFKQAVKQRKRWRSADIPDLMSDLLGMEISANDRDKFHSVRDSRNKIAHGKSLAFDLQKAIGISNFFLDLSRRVEGHVTSRFMIIEKYAH